MENTSLSLLDRVCRERDGQSWQLLASIYVPLLHAWLCRYGLQPSDADDLVQDVLLVMSRELPGFQHNGRPGAFRAWLRGILIHRVQHFWRSRQQRPLTGDDSAIERALEQLADPASELSREWDREHDRHLIHQLVDRISGRFAQSTLQAFRRTVLEGLPPDNVARELGLTPNAVIIAKCRVLKELRREAQGLLGSDSSL
jgi:RNA polymerase sigma-70 factor (ECF subfamily)